MSTDFTTIVLFAYSLGAGVIYASTIVLALRYKRITKSEKYTEVMKALLSSKTPAPEEDYLYFRSILKQETRLSKFLEWTLWVATVHGGVALAALLAMIGF